MSKNKPDDYLKPPALKTNIVERAAALREAMRAAKDSQEGEKQPAPVETGQTHSPDMDAFTSVEPTAKIGNLVQSNDDARRPTFAERMNADRQAAYEKNVRANMAASLKEEQFDEVQPKLSHGRDLK